MNILGSLLISSLFCFPPLQDAAKPHQNLKSGLKAASKSRKPVLVITTWAPKV